MQYYVFKDGFYFADYTSQSYAIDCARADLNLFPDSVFTVENEDGYLVASFSKGRIIGEFNKQEWGGRKGNDAVFIGTEQFDATDAVLLLDPSAVRSLKDSDESSDEIGRSHIDWSGPCYVHIVDAVCNFFGVDEIGDVTDEALLFVRNELKPAAPIYETVTLSIKVRIRVSSGADKQDFVDNLDYSISSNTPGVTVSDTEIIASE